MKSIAKACMMALIAISMTGKLSAQGWIDTTNCIRHLLSIEEAYFNANYLSVNYTYYYNQVDSASSYADTMAGNFKIHRDNYSFILDSVEFMQNEFHRITVFNNDSVMQLENPTPFHHALFRVDLFDSLFKKQDVYGVTIADSGTRKYIKFDFVPLSQYRNYEILFDTATKFISEVRFVIKTRKYLSPLPGSGFPDINYDYISVRTVYAQHATNAFTDSVFASSRFFVQQGGQYIPVAPFNGYDFIKNTIDQ